MAGKVWTRPAQLFRWSRPARSSRSSPTAAAATGCAPGSSRCGTTGSVDDDLAGRVHVGDGRVVHAVRRARRRRRTGGLGARRPCTAVRRRQRVRHALRRRLRALRRPRADAPPAVDRVGAHRARARRARRRGRRALPRRARTRPRDAGDRAVGLPAPLHAAALVRRRRRLPRRARTAPTRGPGTSTSSPRRSATSSAAGSRSTRRTTTPRRLPAAAAGRPATTTATSAAVADEAIHLATAEAAVRLRQTGAPVASIFGLSPHRRAGRRPPATARTAERLYDMLLGARARAVPRRRAAGAAAASRSSVPTSPAPST